MTTVAPARDEARSGGLGAVSTGLAASSRPPLERPGARLWHNRSFNTFWLGQTLSALGDAFAMLAMPLLVLQATGSVAQMGLLTGTMGVASLVSGVLAGPLVDRLDRRRLMILCDSVRVLVYSLIPLGWWAAGPQVWLIYITAALGASFGMVFGVAYITAVPNLVDKDQITDANGRLQTSGGISFVAGPILAGIVIAQFGAATAMGIDAVSFAVSAISLALIRLRKVAVAPRTGGLQSQRLSELLAGVRFLFNQPLLRTVTIVMGIMNLVTMGGMDLFIFRLKHDLHQSAGTVGFVFGMASIGAILAGLLTPMARRKLGYGVCWIGGLAGTGLALAAFAFTTRVPVIVALSILFILVNTVMNVTNMSLRQEITPDHLLGRVTAAFWTLAGIASPIGAAVSTSLAAIFGVPAILAGMGAITAALAVISVFTPVCHRRPELLYAQE